LNQPARKSALAVCPSRQKHIGVTPRGTFEAAIKALL
jgi:hypothetical protein